MNPAAVQQSVKDVVVDLQGDSLIQYDKIGTSNCKHPQSGTYFDVGTSPVDLSLSVRDAIDRFLVIP